MRQLRGLIFYFGLCLAAPALGQTLALDINGVQNKVVSRTQCDESVRVHWVITTSTTKCEDLKIWMSNADCDTDGPDTTKDEKMIRTVTDFTALSGDVAFQVKDMPIFTGVNAAGACGLSDERTYNICGTFKVADTFGACNTNTAATRASSTPNIKYDALAPDAPVIEEVIALDGRLSVKLSSNASDGIEYQVYVREQGTSVYRAVDRVPVTFATAPVANLVNGTTYELEASVIDVAGNESPRSAVATGTPVQTAGYFEMYKSANGSEKGGCTGGGGELWALGWLCWAGAQFVRRRR